MHKHARSKTLPTCSANFMMKKSSIWKLQYFSYSMHKAFSWPTVGFGIQFWLDIQLKFYVGMIVLYVITLSLCMI